MNDADRPLPELRLLTLLVIEGADARTLLQGQLSNDLRRLTPLRALLASCNSAQGRVQYVLTLVQREEGSSRSFQRPCTPVCLHAYARMCCARR